MTVAAPTTTHHSTLARTILRRSSQINNDQVQPKAIAISGNRLLLKPARSLSEVNQRMAKVTSRPIDCTDASTACVPITEPTRNAVKTPMLMDPDDDGDDAAHKTSLSLSWRSTQ